MAKLALRDGQYGTDLLASVASAESQPMSASTLSANKPADRLRAIAAPVYGVTVETLAGRRS